MTSIIFTYDDDTQVQIDLVLKRYWLDPSETWVWFPHDYQIGDYWNDKEPPKNRDGYNRGYPDTKGRPETVVTFEKDDRVSLTPEQQQFHEDLFSLAAFGKVDRERFASELENSFMSTMAANRVITNDRGYPEGYMPLAIGGNIGKVIGEGRPNAKFGLSYVLECLDASKKLPDVEEVYFEKPWLWSKATICRYAYPADNIQGLGNPWQHVIPFPQLDLWNAHTPLLLISNTGTINVQRARCEFIVDGKIPNPYNPHLEKSFL